MKSDLNQLNSFKSEEITQSYAKKGEYLCAKEYLFYFPYNLNKYCKCNTVTHVD